MSSDRVLPGTERRPLNEALLARGERHLLSPEDRRRLRGQRVLITGAAGHLGAELARRMAQYRPAHLTLMDQSDSGLVRLELELLEERPALAVNAVLGDVGRLADVRHVMRSARPEVVFHLAAATEVSTAERAVCAAVRTNVFGTMHVAREASLAGARLVLVSAHEAGGAATVAAATRKLSELVALSHGHEAFRPVIVRVDELIDRPGGLVPRMVERLRTRRPILVQHAGVMRALMTTPEAVSLILKSDLVGEAGEMYRLDTGPSVRLVELAERLVTWARAIGIQSVPVRVLSQPPSGDRPHLHLTTEPFRRAAHARLRVRRDAGLDTAALSRILRALRHDLRRRDALGVLASLRAAVPQYQPSTTAREVAAAATLYAPTSGLSRPSLPLTA